MFLHPIKLEKLIHSSNLFLKEQDGFISLVGIFWLSSFGLIATAFIQIQASIENDIQVRAKAYLCFQSIIKDQNKLVSNIVKLNHAISTAKLMQLFPPSKVAGEALEKTSKFSQYLLNIKYYKGSLSCPLKVKILNPSPYGKFLKRSKLGHAQLKNKEWSLIIHTRKTHWPFILQAKVKSKELVFNASLNFLYKELPLSVQGVWEVFSSKDLLAQRSWRSL